MMQCVRRPDNPGTSVASFDGKGLAPAPVFLRNYGLDLPYK
jgi:hypothetical protein